MRPAPLSLHLLHLSCFLLRRSADPVGLSTRAASAADRPHAVQITSRRGIGRAAVTTSRSIGVAFFAALLLAGVEASAQSDQQWPTAFIIGEDFDTISDPWQPALGAWSRVNGTYVSSNTAGGAVSTIVSYYAGCTRLSLPLRRSTSTASRCARACAIPAHSPRKASGSCISIRMRPIFTRRSFQRPGSYRCAAWSMASSTEVLSTGLHFSPGRNEWFDLEIQWNDGQDHVQGQRRQPVQRHRADRIRGGQVGLVAEGVQGTFDNVFGQRAVRRSAVPAELQ